MCSVEQANVGQSQWSPLRVADILDFGQACFDGFGFVGGLRRGRARATQRGQIQSSAVIS